MLGKLIVTLVAFTITSNAAVEPQWAVRSGGPGNDSATLVRADADGNAVVAGYMTGTSVWGGNTLVSHGAFDLVLAKYDRSGAPLWARNYGGAGTEVVTGMALDNTGNILLYGYFIGSGSVGGETWATFGAYDAFVAKYTPTGEHIWSHRYGGTMSDLFTGLVVDSGGNVVVGGWFQGTVNFGGDALTSPFNSAPGALVAKYTPSGTHVWSKTFSAGNGNYGYGVALGVQDSVVLVGSFFSWIDFGGGRLTAVSPAYQNIYLAKFDSNGTHVWSKRYGGAKGDAAMTVACDSNGDVLAAGKFYQQTDLGGGTITGTAIDQDGWIGKYRGSDGSFIWAKGLTGNNGIWCQSLATDATGNVTLSGYFYGKFSFGTTQLASVLNSYDGFLANFTPDGATTWALSVGGPGTDGAACVTETRAGDTLASGYFSGTAAFGTKTLVSAGSYDAFVLSIPGGAPAPQTLSISVSVPPGTYAPGDLVTITATVTASGPPVPQALVTFSATAPLTGTVSTFSATTDASGTAVWPFVVPPTSESGKWLGNAVATKQGFTAGTAGFTFCSCACK